MKAPFDRVVETIISELKKVGFTTVMNTNICDAFKSALKVKFRNYRILTAFNPAIAYKAISLESHMGLVVPCNVVVQEHENGEVEITALSTMDSMDKNLSTDSLVALADELQEKLMIALDEVQHDGIKSSVIDVGEI